jgi:hypothetical protein
MHSPHPGEIYFLERPRLRRATHGHPCLVLRVEGGTATINFISSEFGLFRPGTDLAMYDDWPEFGTTGLDTSSFLVGGEAVQIPVAALPAQPLGHLEGRLKTLVDDWWGEVI